MMKRNHQTLPNGPGETDGGVERRPVNGISPSSSSLDESLLPMMMVVEMGRSTMGFGRGFWTKMVGAKGTSLVAATLVVVGLGGVFSGYSLGEPEE